MPATGKISLPEGLSTAIKRRALEVLTTACHWCGAPGATRQPCRTAYADDRLNEVHALCPECAEEYHAYWDCAWAEYHAIKR